MAELKKWRPGHVATVVGLDATVRAVATPLGPPAPARPAVWVSHSAAHWVVDSLGPLLALAPVRKRRLDQVAIVDGTLVPTRDRRVAAPSKNDRYSTNLQVAIDADSRLVLATSQPQPGIRNDTTVYRESGVDQTSAGRGVMADGGYRGNLEVIMS